MTKFELNLASRNGEIIKALDESKPFYDTYEEALEAFNLTSEKTDFEGATLDLCEVELDKEGDFVSLETLKSKTLA